nr:hypothetical protein [Tanacetum cinerariifolium]
MVQRDTTRSQKHAYESPSHRSGGHRPHGAPMRPPHRSDGHRPREASMRPSHRPAGHRPHENLPLVAQNFTLLIWEERKKLETTRSQNHTYRSPLHRSGGHRPHGAPMQPQLRSVGHRPHGTSMRPSGHRLHGPSMNPIRPNMNDTRPNKSFFIQESSYETRPFYKSPAVKTLYRAPWVPTVNRNNSLVSRKFPT